MKIQTNYHTHTYLCKHATGTIDDYVDRAIALGYTDIGISDHCPFTEELVRLIYSKRMTMDDFTNTYLPDLDADLDNDEQDMYIFALRYCLGRDTLSAIDCADEIRKNIKEFSTRVLQVMIRDIEGFLSRHPIDNCLDKNNKQALCPDYIISTWESLLSQLRYELTTK